MLSQFAVLVMMSLFVSAYTRSSNCFSLYTPPTNYIPSDCDHFPTHWIPATSDGPHYGDGDSGEENASSGDSVGKEGGRERGEGVM